MFLFATENASSSFIIPNHVTSNPLQIITDLMTYRSSSLLIISQRSSNHDVQYPLEKKKRNRMTFSILFLSTHEKKNCKNIRFDAFFL